ncbi:MAG TPA: hypothetical protein VKX96_15795, partial [Chloroflexota bacterium]|nr:hypothetical protein [Chloroflexota bacterium]
GLLKESDTMLNQRAFGLAMGFAYAAYMMVLAWVAALFHVGDQAVAMTRAFYPGYDASFSGGLLGAAYGFATGFALGWGMAWLYNRFRNAAVNEPGDLAPMD